MGGNLLGLLEERGIDWYPLLRTNKVNPHPLQFGVYGDLVYHHGGGFRRPRAAGSRGCRTGDALRKRRGGVGSRRAFPRKGRLGYLRRRIDPVHRYREALAEQLTVINDQVFELIKRDDQFYRQFIDPKPGAELERITAALPSGVAEGP